MRTDLKVNEMKRVKRRRLNHGHVLGRLQRWARDNRTGARPDEWHPVINAPADHSQQVMVIERFQQAKGVSPANEQGLCVLEQTTWIGRRMHRFKKKAHSLESSARFRCIGITVVQREWDKYDFFNVVEHVSDFTVNMIQITLAVDVGAADQKQVFNAVS